jgi:hypothetical protein
MRPIREPAKPSKQMRFLLARMQRDARFADITARIIDLVTEFEATPSMIEDAVMVIAYKLRRHNYYVKQTVLEDE